MLVIKVFGLSPSMEKENLSGVCEVAIGVKELCLKSEDAICWPLPNKVPGEKIIVEAYGKRYAHSIMNDLASALGTAVYKLFPYKSVECTVYSFGFPYGFWSSNP